MKMTDLSKDELRKQIAKLIPFGQPHIADQIHTAYKEAGYLSPGEVEAIIQKWKDAYAFPDKWAKANGYVKLADMVEILRKIGWDRPADDLMIYLGQAGGKS